MKLFTTLMTAGATACLIAAPLATAHETGTETGPQVEKSYDYTGFDRIIIEGVYDVEVRVGPEFSILTSGTEKRMKNAKVTMSGDSLILALKENDSGRKNKGMNNGIHAVITLPALHEVSLKGVGAVSASGIDSNDFSTELEGVGSIELSGRCGHLEASLEGVGSLEARDLECATVEVDVEGMGSAEVYASESIDAEMDGIGSIDVFGNPAKVQKSKNFLSSVTIH